MCIDEFETENSKNNLLFIQTYARQICCPALAFANICNDSSTIIYRDINSGVMKKSIRSRIMLVFFFSQLKKTRKHDATSTSWFWDWDCQFKIWSFQIEWKVQYQHTIRSDLFLEWIRPTLPIALYPTIIFFNCWLS